MSKKHNTKHMSRGASNYGKRLQDRGLSHTPSMADPVLSDNKRASSKR